MKKIKIELQPNGNAISNQEILIYDGENNSVEIEVVFPEEFCNEDKFDRYIDFLPENKIFTREKLDDTNKITLERSSTYKGYLFLQFSVYSKEQEEDLPILIQEWCSEPLQIFNYIDPINKVIETRPDFFSLLLNLIKNAFQNFTTDKDETVYFRGNGEKVSNNVLQSLIKLAIQKIETSEDKTIYTTLDNKQFENTVLQDLIKQLRNDLISVEDIHMEPKEAYCKLFNNLDGCEINCVWNPTTREVTC